jgi:uncharacterized repeat protein (TIGR01451 family)
VGFAVAAYDKRKPLVIDPVLVYSTYVGGLSEDNISGLFADATGIYVAGLTVSPDLPAAGTPYQSGIGGDYDAYVAKLNPAGTALVYRTYLGGSSTDYGLGLAVDGTGKAYVIGLTASADFPVTASAYQSTFAGGPVDTPFDAFLAKLDANGSTLLYSTYLGGTGTDFAAGVAVDAAGAAYVTGRTDSTDFPTAGTPFQAANGGGADAFIAKLNPSLSGAASLVYSTYLGGAAEDRASAIVVDGSGNASVTGRTESTDFPTAGNPYQDQNAGSFDVFVATVNAAGSTLLYSTYLGGTGDDRGFSLARDSSSNLYVTGHTLSTDFPTTVGAFDTSCGSDGTCNSGLFDAFVAKLAPAAGGAASLVYSTYLGGGADDEGEGIAVDTAGNAYVTGYTNSRDFPTAQAFQPVCGVGCGIGFVDAFVTKLNATGAMVFSTYLGGSSSDYGISVFVDTASKVYVAGESFSDNFPTVDPAFPTWSGNYDGFVVRLDTTATTSANLSVDQDVAPDPGTAGSPMTYTLTIANAGPDTATGVRLIDELPAFGLSLGSIVPSQGTCAPASGFFLEVRCDLGSLSSGA